MIEIKYRKKGQVETLRFPKSSLPSEIVIPEGLEGLDLTGYSVVKGSYKRHGHEKAQETWESMEKRVILLYTYNWTNGWGEGLLLPDTFNPSKLKFYKTQEQVEKEAEEEVENNVSSLIENFKKAMNEKPYPDNNFDLCTVDCDKGEVRIGPQQNVYYSSGMGRGSKWYVFASTLEEALQGVKERSPYWQEINELGRKVVMDYGLEVDGNRGCIALKKDTPEEKNFVCQDFLFIVKKIEDKWEVEDIKEY